METQIITTPDKTTRYRVNFEVSTKGVISPSVTVELVNQPREMALLEAEDLLARALLIAKTHTNIQAKE